MLSSKFLKLRISGNNATTLNMRAIAWRYNPPDSHHPIWWGPEKANGRTQVGFGMTGDPYYQDRYDHPYPGMRFRKENDPEFKAVREKELGDWKLMTLEEKKMLYRFSFRQTFQEQTSSDGHWKLYYALVLWNCTLGLISQRLYDEYIAHPPYPWRWDKLREIRMWRRIEHGERYIHIGHFWNNKDKRWKY